MQVICYNPAGYDMFSFNSGAGKNQDINKLSGAWACLVLLISFGLIAALSQMFRYYDVGHQWVRTVLLIALGIVCAGFARYIKSRRMDISPSAKYTLIVYALLIAVSFIAVRGFIRNVNNAGRNGYVISDQGQTVARSIILLREGIDPYGRNVVSEPTAYVYLYNLLKAMPSCEILQDGIAAPLPPRDYWLNFPPQFDMGMLVPVISTNSSCAPLYKAAHSLGIKYGPAMLFVYAPFYFIFGVNGILICNAVFLAALCVVLWYGVWKITRSFFASGLSLLPVLLPSHPRWDVLDKGHTDIIPTLFLVLFLFSWIRGKTWRSALFLGLSLSAKAVPALLFVPFLFKKPKSILLFAAVALAVYGPFFIWDPVGIWNDLSFPFTYTSVPTSIASLLPPYIMTILRLIAVAMALIVLKKAWGTGSEQRGYLNYMLIIVLAALMLGAQFDNNYITFLLPILSFYLIMSMAPSLNPGQPELTG